MRLGLAIGLAALVAGVLPGPGLAHEGIPGYVSSITAIEPLPAGVTVTVLEGSDRLTLENNGDEEIVVLGYDGEPYLRFTPDGVFRNTRSPATHLNEDRFANVTVPETADPQAPPEWELVSSRNRYEWHDHRIHWMSEIAPPQVRTDPDSPQRIFEWTVPGTSGGEAFAIEGTLDWEPTESSRPAWIYLALPLVALALACGGFLWLRRRRPGPGKRR